MISVKDLLYRLGIDYTVRGPKVFARCPNPEHRDRSASWMIRDEPGEPHHGRHRCLACDFHGGPYALVRAVLDCTPKEAHDFLQSSDKRAPLALDISVDYRELRRPGTLEVPRGVTITYLHEWPELYRRYLEDREVSAEQVERWGLGYCDDDLERRLKGRVWLPVRNRSRELVGWTARAIADRREKYMSANKADGADASVVFGEAFWPPSIDRSKEDLYLVEGPFDALALDRFDRYVGALRGSDLDPGQAMKFTGWRRLVVATDPDAAGQKAADLIGGLARWVEIVRIPLPVGFDVAKLAVEAPHELLTLIS